MKNVVLILLLSTVLFSCKKDLVDTSKNEIDDVRDVSTFNARVADGVSMVFFHASWCSNCEELRPTITAVSQNEEFSDVTFLEIDYDEAREVFSDNGVDGFPQVLFFKDGAEQERLVGKNQTESNIKDILNKYR